MNLSQRLRTCAKHTGLDAVIELLQEAADEIDALQARAQATHAEAQQPDNAACGSVQKRHQALQPATPEPLADHSDHVAEIAARLRLVAKLAGCPDAVPDEDGRAVGCIFSVLGNMRRALESKPAATEPVYWEWRHLSTHPDTVDFGKWSEWKRVEARSAIHTIEDALAEFRAYIARGYKYELRALYDRPAPSVPADVVRVPLQVLKDASEALGNFVSDHGWGDTDMQAMDNLDAYIARHEAIDAAMLAAK